MEGKKAIIRCANALLGRCDGAQTLDGVGFNKFDARFVRDVMANYENDGKLTPKQWNALKESLVKYKKQLKMMGYENDYKTLIDASFETEKNKVEVSIREIEGDKWVCLSTPYNEKFKNELKQRINHYKRQFDFDTKEWQVVITPSKEEAKKALEILEKHFDEFDNTQFYIPDVKFGQVQLDDNEISFETQYDEDFVRDIKELSSPDWTGSYWKVSLGKFSDIEKIKKIFDRYDLDIDDDVYKFVDNKEEELREKEKHKKELIELSKQESLESDYEVELPNDDLELYPFQKYAVKRLDLQQKGLIADEMGLGKTVEVLTHLYNHQKKRPVVVVVPSSVKVNWKREIIKWTEATEDDICILEGNKGDISKSKWYIVNYAILHYRLSQLKNIDYKALVIDESHYAKNHKAKRTKAVTELSRKVDSVYCLTGTPMPNRPIELWSQLQLLNPEVEEFQSLWGNNGYEGFAKRYCGAVRTKWGWDVDGATNLDELQNKLRESIMVRRKKLDVLEELEEKRRIKVPIEIENREDYNKAEMRFGEWMRENEGDESNWKKAEVLVKIEKLKQLAWNGKYDYMIDWLDEMVEQQEKQNEKLVIFAHHRELQDKLYNHYEERATRIGGGMTSEERQDVVDKFSNDENIDVCIVSTQAGGVGINLQVANRAVFTEIGWTPSEHNQAEDRIHRIGQEGQVDIYYLMAEDTVEERIFELINEKQRKIDEAIDGINIDEEKGIIINLLDDMSSEDGIKTKSLENIE